MLLRATVFGFKKCDTYHLSNFHFVDVTVKLILLIISYWNISYTEDLDNNNGQ